jgi:uncharacterized membrane protein
LTKRAEAALLSKDADMRLAPPRTSDEKETTRLEAVSDGVMAIAITLLVIELHVQHIDAADTHLLDALRQQWPSYLAYVVSFGASGSPGSSITTC